MVNLNKLAEKGDFKLLANFIEGGHFSSKKNFSSMIEAISIMKQINNPLAQKALKEAIVSILSSREVMDKIWIITIMQGRFPDSLVHVQVAFLHSKDEQGYDEIYSFHHKSFSEAELKYKHLDKFDLEFARPILLDVINNPSERTAIKWYATLALIEIGERTLDTLDLLIKLMTQCVGENNDSDSIRALSYFTGPFFSDYTKPSVIDLLIKVINNEIKASYKGKTNAICALASSGEQQAREYLEEHISKKGACQKDAKTALKFFGENFDIIRSKIKDKF